MEYKNGSAVFTDWIIAGELGEGAYGKVYEIRKTEYGITTKAALKVISIPKSSADVVNALNEGMTDQMVKDYFRGFVDEILKEIAVMSSLKGHPNIVLFEDHKVLEHPGGMGWDILIKMELLTSLQTFQLQHPKLDQTVVVELAKNICSALAYCQTKGMVHRDIKPENIFINEIGQFKLGDFGIARTVEKTSGGLSKKGTEGYMAPEVYLNKEYGISVDMYSLGLVLYRLMNRNRLPFYPPAPQPITFAAREQALADRMKGIPMPPPCDASKPFADIILKACAYDPAERFRTAADMLAALNSMNNIPAQQTVPVQQTAPAPSTMPIQNVEFEKTTGTFSAPPVQEAEFEKTTGAFSAPPVQEVEFEKTTGAFSAPPVQEVEFEKTTGAFSAPPAQEVEFEKTTGAFSAPPVQEVEFEKTTGAFSAPQPQQTAKDNYSFWTCTNCKSSNESGALYCVICGNIKPSQNAAPHRWTCRQCKCGNDGSALFCETCGAQKSTPKKAETAVPNKDDGRYWTCKKCSYQNKYTTTPSNSCLKCGSPRAPEPNGPTAWQCDKCGTHNTTGISCTYCGAAKSAYSPKTETTSKTQPTTVKGTFNGITLPLATKLKKKEINNDFNQYYITDEAIILNGVEASQLKSAATVITIFCIIDIISSIVLTILSNQGAFMLIAILSAILIFNTGKIRQLKQNAITLAIVFESIIFVLFLMGLSTGIVGPGILWNAAYIIILSYIRSKYKKSVQAERFAELQSKKNK